VMALLLVAGATAIGKGMHFLSTTNIIMLYLLAVVIAALRLGFKPALLTAIAGVLAFDFFLVPPYYSFAVTDTQYVVTFISLLTVGAVISTLVARARKQTETIKTREEQTTALYALTRDLSSAPGLDGVLATAIRHVADAVQGEIAFLLPAGESLTPHATSPGFSLTEKEKSVAVWSFRNAQTAGRGTDTLSSAELIYLPLQTGSRVVGVMAMKLPEERQALSPQDRRLLEALTIQIAGAVERARLAHEAEEAQLMQATERLERSLLNSVSHDLRTPLSSITGALSSLRDGGSPLDADSRREMIELAWEEAERMNRFVTNLLDITRLESGALRIKKEPYDVQDLVGSCAASFGPRVTDKRIEIRIPPGLPLVPMDSVLMSQVINNLLDNAVKYSPRGGTITVAAHLREERMEIEIADEGPGIPLEHLGRIFDKFFRISANEQVGGTGLGLAISKGIVEAHGGKIRAENRREGGAKIIFALPLAGASVQG
ncbi:MAG TPA: DUF4118 domain-containing protein, partial [Thermodesulfobacteriota bacterium]|nr:DUF4118 domain-containing protein [Thermodesulfobacteriota bacterium]